MTGRARCIRFEFLEPRQMLSANPWLTPSQVTQAYGINQINFGATPGNGSGQTIAIIDPGDDPNIQSDLATFDGTFGLQAPPSFSVVGETGLARPTYAAVQSASESGTLVTITTTTPYATFGITNGATVKLSDVGAGASSGGSLQRQLHDHHPNRDNLHLQRTGDRHRSAHREWRHHQ